MSLAASPRPSAARARRSASEPVQSKPGRSNPLFQDMIVYQDDSAASLTALRYAQMLAAAHDGHVTCLVLGLVPDYPVMVYGDAYLAGWEALQAKAEADNRALETRMAERIKKTRFPSELRRVDSFGTIGGWALVTQAHYADCVFIGFSKNGGTDIERQLFEATLFGSGRPVIVVPEAYEPKAEPEHVLIGWQPRRESARAIHDALPALQKAEAVKLLIVDDRNTLPESDDPGADIARHLARHDVIIEAQCVPQGSRTVAQTLCEEARFFGADLMVLGGYGHSRMREWILGGVTRDILALAEVPVMFSH